jgi:multicomponent K+:H+ antiporter subunit G
METLLEVMISALLLVSAFFTLVGSIGLTRLPDFFTRLHAPTKATTLGVGGVLVASMIYALRDGILLHELLITLFLFVTAPVSAHLLAQAALRLRLKSRAPLPPLPERE